MSRHRRARTATARPAPSFESLENRRLFAVGTLVPVTPGIPPITVGTDGVVTVYGTRRADTITVTRHTAKLGTRHFIDLTVNGNTVSITAGGVTRIRVQTGEGADTVDLSNAVETNVERVTVNGGTFRKLVRGEFLPSTVLTGGGNDTVTGGGAGDYVDAGNGNDSVLGNAGNDEILGQTGDDSLVGGAGEDTLRGGDGDDELRGGDVSLLLETGKLTLTTATPGGGTVTFAGGDNTVVDLGTAGWVAPDDGAADVLIGGAGRDTFFSSDPASERADFNTVRDRLTEDKARVAYASGIFTLRPT